MKVRPGPAWILFVVVALALSTPAYAYLDPGTGSMIVAAVVAVFATIAMGIKTYWYKLTSLFRNKDSDNGHADDESRSG